MTRRFVIVVEGAAPGVKEVLAQRIQGSQMGYWHWADNVWLIVTPQELTAKSIADWLEATPGVVHSRYLVLRVDGDSREWWGRQPPQSWDWFNKLWM